MSNKPETQQEMGYEARTQIKTIVPSLLKTSDGVVLILLVTFFLFVGLYPTAALLLLEKHCAAIDSTDVRLTSFVMPLALVGEYFWFKVGKPLGQSSIHVVVILIATALIPFIKCFFWG